LAIFKSDHVVQKNLAQSALIMREMQVLTDLPIQHLRQQGMIFAFDVVTDNHQFAKQCYQLAMQHGLLLRPIGNTVYYMPPYTINADEIGFMVQNTHQVIKRIL